MYFRVIHNKTIDYLYIYAIMVLELKINTKTMLFKIKYNLKGEIKTCKLTNYQHAKQFLKILYKKGIKNVRVINF